MSATSPRPPSRGTGHSHEHTHEHGAGTPTEPVRERVVDRRDRGGGMLRRLVGGVAKTALWLVVLAVLAVVVLLAIIF